MVVPENANVQKAQCIAEECGEDRLQRFEGGPMRCLQLQYHNRDDYRDNTITKKLRGETFPFIALGRRRAMSQYSVRTDARKQELWDRATSRLPQAQLRRSGGPCADSSCSL
jgi:hypothetical protein